MCTLPNPLGSEFLEVNPIRLGNEFRISVLNPWKKHLFEPNPVGKKYSHKTGLCEYSQKKVARTSTVDSLSRIAVCASSLTFWNCFPVRLISPTFACPHSRCSGGCASGFRPATSKTLHASFFRKRSRPAHIHRIRGWALRFRELSSGIIRRVRRRRRQATGAL